MFAQTIVSGKNEGVNAFLVPIRDASHKPLPGVSIVDMGVKFGLNGVDNAQLKYSQVRIPRENMMNRYADVTPAGEFQSEVKNISARFFKVTERLLSGRICISSIALGPTRACLHIAIKYGQMRKSIGIEGNSTVPIFNYQLQQNALMPLLARTLALNQMYNYARDVYANPKGFEHELLSICCITKTMLGWNLNNVAVTCRERCGGMGYLAVSRFGEYIALAHSALTAEGDNRVLMTKITKDYMTNVAKHGFKVPVPSQNVATQIATYNDVTQLDTLLDLLKFREASLFKSLTGRMAALKKQGVSDFNILMRECSDNIQDLAMAYGERNTMEQAIASLAKYKNAENRKAMTVVYRVFGCDILKRDLGYYLKAQAVGRVAAKALIETQNELIKAMAANVDPLVGGLNVPHEQLYVPIALNYERYYSEPNYGEIIGARL